MNVIAGRLEADASACDVRDGMRSAVWVYVRVRSLDNVLTITLLLDLDVVRRLVSVFEAAFVIELEVGRFDVSLVVDGQRVSAGCRDEQAGNGEGCLERVNESFTIHSARERPRDLRELSFSQAKRGDVD